MILLMFLEMVAESVLEYKVSPRLPITHGFVGLPDLLLSGASGVVDVLLCRRYVVKFCFWQLSRYKFWVLWPLTVVWMSQLFLLDIFFWQFACHINVRCRVFSCLMFSVSSASIVICFTIFIHKMLD